MDVEVLVAIYLKFKTLFEIHEWWFILNLYLFKIHIYSKFIYI